MAIMHRLIGWCKLASECLNFGVQFFAGRHWGLVMDTWMAGGCTVPQLVGKRTPPAKAPLKKYPSWATYHKTSLRPEAPHNPLPQKKPFLQPATTPDKIHKFSPPPPVFSHT
ncbi:hypothetical protein L873DRAFT_1795912 [Choiromyces venosus 120613-1]|uniref:Uncharacterized protein n=1 Tax=Choiromyces venosus 120613-1 TaxID=1336337 RepID=A0A3N4IUX1_9PEZI|nr:hypothetical protein L873DRAFT_1795912 [Choiromyces venosus 120613-1]